MVNDGLNFILFSFSFYFIFLIFLYFIFKFLFFFFILNLGGRCNVMSHVTVTQSCDTKKNIEHSETNNII